MAVFGSVLSTDVFPPMLQVTSEVVTPSVGATITISNATTFYIINPSGGLGSLTIKMAASPTDNQVVFISTTQALTLLTLNANTFQSILNVPTTMIVGGFCGFIWNASLSKWFRIS